MLPVPPFLEIELRFDALEKISERRKILRRTKGLQQDGSRQIDPACSRFRRRGIARDLMRALETQLEGQHVFLFTDDAEDFYADIGYTRRGAGYELVVGKWLKRYDPKPHD